MGHGIRVVLFDLGGVLIRLRGVQVLLAHLEGRMDEPELMRRWLASPAVRAFESGNSSLETFCRDMVAELDLPMEETAFLEVFRTFLEGPFPLVSQTLPMLAGRIRFGILSNTSEPHWQEAMRLLPALSFAQWHFLSFRMGLVKPDAAMFRAVLDLLGEPPETVLYFDDHPTNVAAARELGIQAVPVNGFGEAVEAMEALGIL